MEKVSDAADIFSECEMDLLGLSQYVLNGTDQVSDDCLLQFGVDPALVKSVIDSISDMQETTTEPEVKKQPIQKTTRLAATPAAAAAVGPDVPRALSLLNKTRHRKPAPVEEGRMLKLTTAVQPAINCVAGVIKKVVGKTLSIKLVS